MVELKPLLDEGLTRAVLSNPRRDSPYSKVTVRPVLVDQQLRYQFEYRQGAKATHANLLPLEAENELEALIRRDFRQALLQTPVHDYQVLNGEKLLRRPPTAAPDASLTHDRPKRRVLAEGEAVPFLVELGVMTPDGKVRAQRYDKFRQVNRFLELVDTVLPNRPVRIVDFGSGKSYLTFALYHLLAVQRGLDVEVVGLDLKEEVIERCKALAQTLGYERLRFEVGDIALFEGERADVVVSLHACDTATDAALARAVEWRAEVILAVPCCQHELFEQVRDDALSPLLDHGILRERFASLATDAARAQLLRAVGYDAHVVEFVDLEHTAKNLLIRAVRRGDTVTDAEAMSRYRTFKGRLGIDPALERALADVLPKGGGVS
ncbi:MAG: SAM-dependent methyltransferase [Actinobacteria bacterium]|nr:MAG: SAM-dependent methyltransferase [Actinomycetota bacterium]